MKQLTALLICFSLFWAAVAQAAGPLKVGTTLWPGYEPLYLAQHNGYYDDRIRVINYPSASEVIRSFRNQALEVAALTLDEVVLLRESDIDVQIILICDISDGADAILARPPIASLADLKGHRIAVESAAVGAYVLTRALEIGQIALTDVQPVNRENNEQYQAYLDNEVDAVVTYEPVRSQLLSAGATEIFTSRQIPGEVVDILAVERSVIERRQQDLTLLIKGWYQALDDLRNKPQQSHEYIAARHKISVEEVDASLDGLEFPDQSKTRKLISGSPSLIERSFARLVDTMRSNNLLLDKDFDQNDLVTTRFLP